MKTIKIGMILCVMLLAVTSCKKGVFCLKADGNVKTQIRDVSGFSEVELSTSADLYIEQGDAYEVKIEASENLFDIIETNVDGDVLKIKLKKGKCLRNNLGLKVYITMPELVGIEISGSGDIYVGNEMISEKMVIDISGSGNVEFDTLTSPSLIANISGSGDLFLSSEDTSLTQDLKISGSGEIHAVKMPVKKSTIKISGSGECEVFVTESLKVKISGSGDVRYKGEPTVEGVSTGSGTISPY